MGDRAADDVDDAPSVDAEGSTLDAAREPMANARPTEAAPLARARFFEAMFGHSGGAPFGRFRVLDRIASGGMGVVYEAYDPDLARGVALKLVDVTAIDRETALAEAKALARLSHPNVVPIYDVGLERDNVYLVMELVRGKTLEAWAIDRAPREILAVYQQAGAALAAAHAAGLVHRDFKPTNALVGADGRVRVVDFGLACEADDPSAPEEPRRGAAGTPRFMAPEIAAGKAVTPAADQYSFAVALAEALGTGSESPPRRILAALERGRAPDPAARFPSIAELLRALARDPARTWRRASAIAALAAVVGAGAFVVGQRERDRRAACGDGAAELEAAWTAAARGAALERVATLGEYGHSLRAQLDKPLAQHAAAWQREFHAACVDRRGGVETDTMSERRTTCLRRGTDALAAVGALFATVARDDLEQLPRAVQSLPDPGACSDRAALASDVEPPPRGTAGEAVARVRKQVAQVRIEVGAGRYAQAFDDARAAVAAAREVHYAPALAEALLAEGHARMNLPERKEAEPILAEAAAVALAARADDLAVEAWARRAWVAATAPTSADPLAGQDLVESLARRTASAAFARALLYNNIGTVELARHRRTEARASFTRALAEAAGAHGALELVAIRANLGLVDDDHVRADAQLAAAAAELAERLGADHPDTLAMRAQRAYVTLDDAAAAEALLARTCPAYGQYAGLAEPAGECWTELGMVRWTLGDVRGAATALAAAQGPDAPYEAAPYLALFRGDARAAANQFAAALAQHAPAPDEAEWERLTRGVLSLGLGAAKKALADPRGAREALERAIADLDSYVRAHPAAAYERALARARAELASLGRGVR